MSWPGALVSRTAAPPVLATDQTLPSATKTIRSPEGCGKRGSAAWVAVADAVANKRAMRGMRIMLGPAEDGGGPDSRPFDPFDPSNVCRSSNAS